MRILVPVLCLLSFSSCLALLGAGAITSLALAHSRSTSSSEWRAGAEREARERAIHAEEAALIRQRYDEMQRRSPASAVTPAPAAVVPPTPTPPPLVPLEPVRVPLRPRELTR